MKVKISSSEINGTIVAPPSKSYTHRALFISLLTKGENKMANPLISRDTEASLNAIKLFGAKATWKQIISSGIPTQPSNIVYCYNSGTTARITTAIGAITKGITIIDGSDPLRKRPMSPIIEVLEQFGVKVYSRGGKLPIKIIGGKNGINNHCVQIRGDVSSQFVTGLLILAPKIGLDVKIATKLKSKPYVEITVRMLIESGVKVEREGYKRFSIEEQDFKPRAFKIPGDYSSSAYILAAGALYGKVRVTNLDPNDVQGDKKIIDLLKEMGAKIRVFKKAVEVEKRDLVGINVNCSDIPDLVPILAVLGAYASGKTVIYGAEHLRFKETDRLHVLTENLKKMGVKVEEKRDGLIIQGSNKVKRAILDPYLDHRIAMALSIVALGAEGNSTILNAECVRDSYPEFYNHLKNLGGRVLVKNGR